MSLMLIVLDSLRPLGNNATFMRMSTRLWFRVFCHLTAFGERKLSDCAIYLLMTAIRIE